MKIKKKKRETIKVKTAGRRHTTKMMIVEVRKKKKRNKSASSEFYKTWKRFSVFNEQNPSWLKFNHEIKRVEQEVKIVE